MPFLLKYLKPSAPQNDKNKQTHPKPRSHALFFFIPILNFPFPSRVTHRRLLACLILKIPEGQFRNKENRGEKMGCATLDLVGAASLKLNTNTHFLRSPKPFLSFVGPIRSRNLNGPSLTFLTCHAHKSLPSVFLRAQSTAAAPGNF